MQTFREDEIHFAVRKHLRQQQWTLIGGEYPNGSDDELAPLYVKDPKLARDNSPDHRRHSLNTVVPDLVAVKSDIVLLIELKPAYDESDHQKLLSLLTDRKDDLISALDERLRLLSVDISCDIRDARLIPALGFSAGSSYPEISGFCFFLVEGIEAVKQRLIEVTF